MLLGRFSKPQDIQGARAVDIIQTRKNSAASIALKVKQAYTQYNSAYPPDAVDVLQIVQTCLLPNVQQFFTTELQLILGCTHVVTISDLENVLGTWDEHSRTLAAQTRSQLL